MAETQLIADRRIATYRSSVRGPGTTRASTAPRRSRPCAWASILTIPKASRPDHVAENAGAGDLWLTEAELARISKAFPPGPRPLTLPVL